jgi:uncharacterized protein involved in exopolysaccharide biosynthesis
VHAAKYIPEELRSDNAQSVTLGHYLAVLGRRKWITDSMMVIVPPAAVLFSLGQERLYQASAEVLLSRQNLAANLTGVTDPTLSQQDVEVTQTQAYLALARGGRLPSGEKEDAALLESER